MINNLPLQYLNYSLPNIDKKDHVIQKTRSDRFE